MQVFSYLSLTSTNDEARLLAERGTVLPFLVQALIQTRGRGQYGRTWSSPPGSLTATWAVGKDEGEGRKDEGGRMKAEDGGMNDENRTSSSHLPHPSSFILHPSSLILHPSSFLSLLAGLAVRDAVLPYARGRTAQIKWPNDVWLDGKKLAGILCETATTPGGTAFLIGIGMNVCCDLSLLPHEVGAQAAVLFDPGGPGVSSVLSRSPDAPLPPSPDSDSTQDAVALLRKGITTALLGRLEAWSHKGRTKQLAEIEAADALRGKLVRVTHPQTGDHIVGHACGIKGDGALLVSLGDGRVLPVRCGSVTVLSEG